MGIKYKKINKRTSAGLLHGYWESDLCKRHYNNGGCIGHFFSQTSLNKWKCHYLNGKEIGCELKHVINNKITHQYYFNKLGKKLGEEITWK